MLSRGVTTSLSHYSSWLQATDACCNRGIPFFGGFFFLNDGELLIPKSSEIRHFYFLHDSCRVPRPWDFSSGIIAVFFSP